MQTFLPYACPWRSAEVLDRKRLGKQRVEAYDCFGLLTGFRSTEHGDAHQLMLMRRYGNHPAPAMWHGYEHALALYFNVMCDEWERRGYENNYDPLPVPRRFRVPSWVGNEDFHARHRAALLYKDLRYYSQFAWREQPMYDYIWPA